MHELMARLQIKSSSFYKVYEKYFEDWLLEENRFKDENHTFIDIRPLNLRIIDKESHFQTPIYLQDSMVF